MKWEVTYKNEFIDIQNFHHLYSKISPYQFKFLLLIKFAVPAIWLIFITIPKLGTEQVWIELIIFGLVTLTCYYFIPQLIQRSLKKKLLHNYYNGVYNQILTEHRLSIDKNKIEDQTNLNKLSFEWKTILKIRNDEKSIYIFLNKKTAFIIPLRSFKSKNKYNEFLRLCNNFLSDSKKLNEENADECNTK